MIQKVQYKDIYLFLPHEYQLLSIFRDYRLYYHQVKLIFTFLTIAFSFFLAVKPADADILTLKNGKDIEKEEADFISETITETAENFSKKVAGGIISISNISINLHNESESENNSRMEAQTYSNSSYLCRSALLPGWGHWKKNEKNKQSRIKKWIMNSQN